MAANIDIFSAGAVASPPAAQGLAPTRVQIPALRSFLVVILLLAGVSVARAQSQAEVLVAAMQDGGKVIYLRHAATNHGEVDTGRLGERSAQRNLSAAGRQQAREIGRAFQALRIPANEILASPVFRARDTAEIAFGADQVTVTMDIVADDYAGAQLRRMLEATRRLLRTLPGPGMNRIMVGHRAPLEMVTGRSFPDTVLPEGAMAVFLPGGSTPRLLGTITAERLVHSADVRR
jgi:phosphohistidine phosphatase SixA